MTDIQDESGYIEALGKEAAAKAINDARIWASKKGQRSRGRLTFLTIISWRYEGKKSRLTSQY